MAFLLHDRFAWDESIFGWLLRVNPPGITLMLYSLAIILFLFAGCSFLLLWNKKGINSVTLLFCYVTSCKK